MIFEAAIDPSEVHTGGNAFGFAIVGGELRAQDGAPPRPHFTAVHVQEWRSGSLYEVFGQIAPALRRFGLDTATTDAWSKQALREIGARQGVRVNYWNRSTEDRLRDWESLVAIFDGNQVTIPDNKTLIGDLLGLRRRLTQSSSVVEFAKDTSGRHGDLGQAFALAVARFRTHASLNVEGRRSRIEVLSDRAARHFEGYAPGGASVVFDMLGVPPDEQAGASLGYDERGRLAVQHAADDATRSDWFGSPQRIKRAWR